MFLKIFLISVDGLSSADPSSDWNAPAEEWGNWVDEEKVASVPQPEEISDVQKVKGDIFSLAPRLCPYHCHFLKLLKGDDKGSLSSLLR